MARRRSGISGRRGSSPTSAEAQRFTGYTAESGGRAVKRLLEEQDITARIVHVVYDMYGTNALPEAWDDFTCRSRDNDRAMPLEFTADSPFLELFVSWLAHTWTPAKLSIKPRESVVPHHVPTQTFLAQHPGLDPLLARYLAACIATPFSFFEVVACKAGRRFNCRDLISGTQHVIREGVASTLLRPGQVLYARTVEVDGGPIIDALAPWPIPEDLKSAILDLRADILEVPSAGECGPERARQQLLAHESDLRSFYWDFIEQAFKEDSLRPQLVYIQSPHKAAESLLMMLAPVKTAAERKAESERAVNIREVHQQIVSMFTYVCENWVNEKLPILGGKTALEAVATPEGRLKVQALMDEIETNLSLLPFSLDPDVFRRVRERLGIFRAAGLH